MVEEAVHVLDNDNPDAHLQKTTLMPMRKTQLSPHLALEIPKEFLKDRVTQAYKTKSPVIDHFDLPSAHPQKDGPRDRNMVLFVHLKYVPIFCALTVFFRVRVGLEVWALILRSYILGI